MNLDELERMEDAEGKHDLTKVREEFAEHVRGLKRDLALSGFGALTEEERIPVLQEFARWFLREMVG